jgi:adenine-specific DNA-methyltransferase
VHRLAPAEAFDLAPKESQASASPARPRARPASPTTPPARGGSDEAQVLSYRHKDRRKNNPEVGMVSRASDPEQPKTVWQHDPHLDPSLQWTGKAERLSFAVDTVSLHVHERMDPMSILAAVRKSDAPATTVSARGRASYLQPGLFDAPFENLPLREAIDFYRHDKGWSNRLIAGDSLLVMNSLLQKEGSATSKDCSL